ncbi:alpha/beta hydrolase [Gordonia polyisoprenivorans]|uniref:alpha/beta hydrolase n=1 Tax=Gordonia polyisoprenivorans TaxID=84595 RepID=UPI000380B676|nr:alpha/beta hydrolase [Gordonia polyisoprenivorans]OZC32724.1 alpha/beta hydrolase [Gordonia polyisoprenivorans]QUD83018.1 alpha/beta hydrolase [Gordonia polyisoprenivorans]
MSRATTLTIPLPFRAVRSVMRLGGHLPPGLLGVASRICPVNSDGEHIAPEMLAAGVATRLMPGGDMSGATVERARHNLEVNSAISAERTPPLAVVEDLVIDGPGGDLPATRYRAEVSSTGLVLFFHGGGFSLGSRATHDAYCRRLALDTGVDVLSVEYRLAPEYPFPAAVDDALAAWRFAVSAAPRWGVDTDRLIVAGDSAGGNLAAVLSQLVRGEEVTPRLQLLLYPVTDMTRSGGSREEFATGYFLTAERIEWFTERYVPAGAPRSDPRISPLLAHDLTGLPPAHVVVAGFDPLRDEGIAYADALSGAGVRTSLQRESGMIHGFVNMLGFSPAARQAVSGMHDVVRGVL